jgi:hypothetical protein
VAAGVEVAVVLFSVDELRLLAKQILIILVLVVSQIECIEITHSIDVLGPDNYHQGYMQPFEQFCPSTMLLPPPFVGSTRGYSVPVMRGENKYS